MMMIDHVLIGGASGLFIENSPVAFGLNTLVHLVLDKLPHYFPEKKPSQALTVAIDLTACAVALSFFWFGPVPKSAFWGAMGGIWIDLLLVNSPLSMNTGLGKWHLTRQHHHTNYNFILTDLFIVLVTLLVISIYLKK